MPSAAEAPAAARRWAWVPGRLLPVAVVAAVLAAGLDTSSGGTHPDERLYLSVAREMAAHGSWLTPTLDEQPDFTKPPLLYWASAAGLRVFGPHLWAARLPVAVCALLLALLAGRLARRFGGEPAFVRGVLLLGTSLGVLRYGRLAMMDVPLALALAVGVEAAWTAADMGRPRRLLWVGVAAGVSTLLKGPVGPLLVLSIAGVLLAVRAPALLRTGWAAGALALAVALPAPWFVAMVTVHGAPYLVRFIVVENFGKFTVPWTFGAEAWLFLVLFLLALPWVGLVQSRACFRFCFWLPSRPPRGPLRRVPPRCCLPPWRWWRCWPCASRFPSRRALASSAWRCFWPRRPWPSFAGVRMPRRWGLPGPWC
jgi:4-amino-4-deoxy-L-arabinose transferase-like glycosyltransferase